MDGRVQFRVVEIPKGKKKGAGAPAGEAEEEGIVAQVKKGIYWRRPVRSDIICSPVSIVRLRHSIGTESESDQDVVTGVISAAARTEVLRHSRRSEEARERNIVAECGRRTRTEIGNW